MSNGKLNAIMTALAAMSLDRDQILKQNKELNLKLRDLETDAQCNRLSTCCRSVTAGIALTTSTNNIQ